MTYEEKRAALKALLLQYAKKDLCVAFSGGVDSALLLAMSCEAAGETGRTVHAVTMDTVLHPAADAGYAAETAGRLHAVHHVIRVDELAIPEIRENPVNRCYLCKKAVFQELMAFAAKCGASTVLEGSNEDDLHVYRPGLAAVRELGIRSPLAECHITKQEVRKMAGEYGLPAADRPSSPCLATRLPYGSTLDLELLGRIDRVEEALRARGLRNVRLRVHGDILRIEVDPQAFSYFTDNREELFPILREVGCPYITLDLEGFRSGSMDIHIRRCM